VVWAVATSEVWAVVDLAVVLEVEASEVVRRQCFNLLGMIVVHCNHTSVIKYPVCLTFIKHSCHSVSSYVSSKLVRVRLQSYGTARGNDLSQYLYLHVSAGGTRGMWDQMTMISCSAQCAVLPTVK
jgi:hypothetical protein